MTKNYSKGNIKQLFVSYNGIYSRIIKCTGHLLKIEDFQLLNDLVIFTTPRWGVGSWKSWNELGIKGSEYLWIVSSVK